jgi:hypothetical protein
LFYRGPNVRIFEQPTYRDVIDVEDIFGRGLAKRAVLWIGFAFDFGVGLTQFIVKGIS